MRFCSYFLHFYQIWITFSTDVHKNLLVLFEVVKISTVKSMLHVGLVNYFVCTLHTFVQIWVKLFVKGLHIMLLTINEFSEKQCREDYTFLMGINAVKLSV
jgi:hypothetical protein